MPITLGPPCATLISFLAFSAFSVIQLSSFGALAIDAQGEALLAWKRGLNGSLGVMSNWAPSDPSPCRWSGITCDAGGRVVELNLKYVDLGGAVPSNLTALAASLSTIVLSGTNLSGPIPPGLGDLHELALLDLSDNSLSGAIPGGLCRPGSRLEQLFVNSNRLEGPIPEEIGNLSSLRQLVIYDNQLSGPIPPSIGRLGGLEVFRAGGNKNLLGLLPPEIGNCSSLVMLGLAETSISGALPSTLGQLKRIETLAVYTALLSGPIPPELGQCGELRNIYLYENSLSASIPPQLGNLKKLNNLLLWQNSLVGVIPPELGQCRELAVIDLSMNGLTGPIPASLANLTALQELQLSVNQISGPIPPEISKCSNLTDLELDNNQISGSIPGELGQLSNLQMLYLWQNKLVGRIPAEIGMCENLEAVDLSQNALTGPIPGEIFSLPRLTKLLLLENEISGEIPPAIGNCTSLVRLRANRNMIAGEIPPEIGELKNLSFLDLGSNRLSGPIPPAIAGCKNLTYLNLQSNAIAGAIPNGMFQGLLLLQLLDLSGNSIGGDISDDIGMLSSLNKLVLSGNRFSGEIPPEIGSCSRLQLLDLSKNGLSGGIPASLGKIAALEISLNLSWNALSDGIPPEFSSLLRLGVLDLSHNRLSGDLQPLSGLQNLVALNVSYNNFSGTLPESAFFAKLPVGNFEGNPSLCLARCSGGYGRGNGKRAARIVTVVLLSATVALLATAALFFLGRKRARSAEEEDGGGDMAMSPPWDVTLYQKLEIRVGDVAPCLTTANVIGRGWSGTVYKARLPGAMIAVKRFRPCDEAAANASACEIWSLARVRHRNIVRLLGWAANRKTQLLFYDYLPNGTLADLLHGGSAGAPAVEWETRLAIALGVAEGLSYLHHDCVPGILHRDIKPDNILLGERYEACVADFGLAHIAEEGGAATPPPFAGSYGYIAPEYGCMRRITRKSDVYSFGVVLLEMITGRRAVEAAFGEGRSVVGWVREHLKKKRDPTEVLDERLRGRPDGQVQEMLQALGIALLCASNRSEDRPTMKDVAALLRGILDDSALAGGEQSKAGSGGDGRKAATPPAHSSPVVAVQRGSPQCSMGGYSSSTGDSFK